MIQPSRCKNCEMFSAIYWFVAKLCLNYFTIKCTCWQHKAHVCSKQPKVNKCDDNRFPIAINCCSLLWPSGPLVWYWPYICQESQVVSNIPRRNTLLGIYRVMSQKCRGSVNLPQCPTEGWHFNTDENYKEMLMKWYFHSGFNPKFWLISKVKLN